VSDLNRCCKFSDGYRISRSDILAFGGRMIFKYYASLAEALQAVYPEYSWERSKFTRVAKIKRGQWRNEESLSRALDAAEQAFGIKQVLRLG
jgi:hypothetical protein